MRPGTVRVYAITNSRTVPVIPGLRAIRVGTLAALVAGTRQAPVPSPANLRRYHRTIAAIADALPAALPARFGTLMTEAELAVVLDARAPSFSAALRRVRGRVQMTLRLTGAPTRRGRPSPLDAARGALSASRRADRPPATPGSGRAYLRALAIRDRDISGFDTVRDALRSWIEEERVERRGDVVTVYHLIPRRSSAAYARAAARSIPTAGFRGVVSGPFPPYAFSAW